MTDIIERLERRMPATQDMDSTNMCEDMEEAISEITALRKKGAEMAQQAALIASQARRIEELEDANNDALAAEAQLNLVRKRMEKLEAENKALKKVADFDYLETTVAENRLLRNLLKTFAEDADKWAETVPDDHRPLCTEPNSKTAHPGSETGFTVGDLRRARATLKGETS